MSILRTAIAIVFVVLSVVNSYKIKFDENDIKQLQKALHESAQYMRKEVKDEDVSICIGATRAGKSTLINYLIGNKLKAVRYLKFHPITIEKVDSQSVGPEIGRGSTSKTKIPTKWIAKNFSDLIIWDAPGFDDNRGEIQDITNAYYLYQLVQNVKSLKIILAVDIFDILRDNIKPFVSVLKALENLLGNKMRDHFASISVIFTKVPNTLDDAKVDMEFINVKLEYQFLSSSDLQLSQISKEFIQFLVNNNNRIAFFMSPQIGPVTSAIDVNIFPVIKNSVSIQKHDLQQLHPSISESSKVFLFSVRDKLFMRPAFVELETIVSEKLQEKVKDIGNLTYNKETENKIRTLNKDLTFIQDKLYDAIFHENNFYKKMIILQTIDVDIKREIDKLHLLENIKLLEFVDELLNLEESKILAKSLEGVLVTTLFKVKVSISATDVKLGEITQQKYDEIMRNERQLYMNQLDEVKRQLKLLNEKNNEKKSIWFEILTYAIHYVGLRIIFG